MIDLRINGVSLVQLPGTTVPMELLNSALGDGLEDSFSLPFEVPVEGNEVVLEHVGVLPRRERTKRYANASLYYHGELKHFGVLYVENVENGVVQLSFSVDGFVAALNDRTLKDVDYGGQFSISGANDKMVEWAAARNTETYPTASHCFPMFYNPELQPENPYFNPDHPTWNAGQAYAVNDLVTFEEGTIVRRNVPYQCITITTAGQSPATHPAKWRRTAFGIVNHWDHATPAFFENNPTDGNPYAMVPFFYLKWVLQKVYADLGYTLEGDLMDDTRLHQLAIYNNTALDDGSRAGYLNVTHSTSLSALAVSTLVPSDTESGGPYADPDSLWNNTTYRFTCDAVGRRVFDITYNITPARPGWFRFYIRDAGTLVALKIVADYTIGTPLVGTIRMEVDFVGAHVGTDWELMFDVWENVAVNGTILGARQPSTLNSVRITSWRYDNTNLVNAMAVVINPAEHVPDQAISEFILDMCELFSLERTYDHSRRVAYLNYKKHVLTDEPTDITAQLRSEPVLRLQELPVGYRFTHDVGEDSADLTNRSHEADVDTEADLIAPPGPRSYVVALNSRRLYVSRHAQDGNLYWWPAGWYVPSTTVGNEEDPTDIQPGWAPMVMDLVTSNGEQFLVPVITEGGNSAMYASEGNEPSKRLVFFHGMVDNGNGKDYPFAACWNRQQDGDVIADVSLAWEGTDGLLALLAGTFYERLANAEVLEVDVEANSTVLAAMNNMPVMIQNQRCLIERLPLTYADGLLPLIAQGSRIYKLPPA